MNRDVDVEEVLRGALAAEEAETFDRLSDSGLPDMVTAVFRGRMRWLGAMFVSMILVLSVLAVVCAVRFLNASSVEGMLRWGAGFFVCLFAALNGKTWYWMQIERLATTREVWRVELLVALLATRLRSRP